MEYMESKRVLKTDTTKAVIFDVDGLIVDTEEIYCDTFNKTLSAFGESIPRETYTRYVGIPVETNSADVVKEKGLDISPDAFRDQWMAHFEETISHPELIGLCPGIVELLYTLRGRFPLAIASSTHRPRMMKTLQNGLLSKLTDTESLDDVFTTIVSGTDVARNKPAPDIYLRAASLLGINPEGCIVFEDSEPGVLAGSAAGMTVIAVPNFFTAHQDHSEADLVIESLLEAVELFK